MNYKKKKILILVIFSLIFLSGFVLQGDFNQSKKLSLVEENKYFQNQESNSCRQEDIDSTKIEKYINEKGYKVSIGYYDITSGNSFYYQENKLYYGASLIKTLDALYLYDKNLVTEEIDPYIQKAISVSDNASHEYLVKYIGRENLKDYGLSLGATNTLKINGNFGNTTVCDQMIYIKKLYSIIQTNDKLKSYFINNYGNYMKIDGVTNLHKYGYFNNYFHDAGIFLSEKPYILIILTEHGNGDYKGVIKDISNLIYKYHTEQNK